MRRSGGYSNINHPDDLEWQLERRDVAQRRRRFLKTTKKLFKRLRRDGDQGNGWIFAPHLWHVTTLGRDSDEEFDAGAGPTVPAPYRDIYRPEVRAHLHTVLRALAIDLMVVDDALSLRVLNVALRAIFEAYDLFEGARILEERQLSGIPGLRAVIHVQDLCEEESVAGRARILQLMPDDDGGSKTPVEPLGRRVLAPMA